MIAKSWPGTRLRRLSQPSIHFPRSVYSCSFQIGFDGLRRFSFSAKKSSFAYSSLPPRRSEARSSRSLTARSLGGKAPPANPGLLHHAPQLRAEVGCDFVAVADDLGGDGEGLVGIPDHKVCIVADGDLAFAGKAGHA